MDRVFERRCFAARLAFPRRPIQTGGAFLRQLHKPVRRQLRHKPNAVSRFGEPAQQVQSLNLGVGIESSICRRSLRSHRPITLLPNSDDVRGQASAGCHDLNGM